MTPHILVTGAAGFIGSHLSRYLLSKGCTVTGLDNFDPFYSLEQKKENLRKLTGNEKFTFHEADITQPKTFKKLTGNYDIVIHLAAKAGVLPSLKNPLAYAETNINGTAYLLEWMQAEKIQKLVFASSSSVYGNSGKGPFSETMNVDKPVSFYASTKKSCELMTHVYHDLYDFDVMNLRFFTVYGPNQRPDLAIHKFFKRIHQGEDIQVFGDGSTGRDYTFIDDTVFGIYCATEYLLQNTNVYETVNLGNNKPVLLSELISEIEAVTGITAKKKYMPKQPGDVDYTYADITKARKLFGYNPNTGLHEGLEAFREWFEAFYKTEFKR